MTVLLGKEIVAEKHRQIEKLIGSAEFDLWLIFAREARDPISPLVVGTRYVGTAAFLFTKKQKIAICADYDALALRSMELFDEVIPYSAGIKEPLTKVLSKLEPKRIGVNFSQSDDCADGLSHGMYLFLEELVSETLSGVELVSAEQLAASVRAKKSPEELRRLKEAIRISDEIFKDMITFIRPGRTELEIGQRCKALAEEKGATLAEDSLPIVATGKAGLGHRGPSEASVTAGDVLIIDMGLCYEGYTSDFARTYYTPTQDGAVPDSLLYRFETVRDAIALAARMIKPGVRGYEPKEAADEFIRQRDIDPPSFSLGHQVGIACHDGGLSLGPRSPRYAGRVEQRIKEGTLFTLEPFLVPKKGEEAFPIGVEEIIRVTANGCEFLTDLQQEIWLTHN